MARSTLAALIILTFAAVSLFGFAVMADGNIHIMCPAEQMQGKECRAGTDPFALLLFHVGAFKSFIAGIFSVFALAAFLISFVVLVLAGSFTLFVIRPFGQPAYLQKINLSGFFAHCQFLRWLSLHENSPSCS